MASHDPILCVEVLPGLFQCPFRKCRKRYSADILRSGHSPLSAVSLLRLIFAYAVGDGMDAAARGAKVNCTMRVSSFTTPTISLSFCVKKE